MRIVYALIDQRDLLIHYIGKSTRGIGRARRHSRNDPNDHGVRCAKWIADVHASDGAAMVTILETVAAGGDALANAERWWIAYGRACGWPLTNMTNGGDGKGRTWTQEQLDRHREIQRSPETCEKKSAAIRALGDRHPAKQAEARAKIVDKHFTKNPELRAKHAAAMQRPEVRAKFSGDKHPMRMPENRAKASARRKAEIAFDPARREQLALALAARWNRPDAQEEFSAQRKAKFASPEARAQLQAALAKRWANYRAKKK